MSDTDRQRGGDDVADNMTRVDFRVTRDMRAEIETYSDFYLDRSALIRDAIRRHICYLKIEGNYPDMSDTGGVHCERTAIRIPAEMRDHIDQYAAYYETKSALIRDAIASHLHHLKTSIHPENGELPD
jgi:metal-responsive CopG/Arc/MetJ family transcriptional regulator